MALTQMQWVRTLLNDVGMVERELATASGLDTIFYVQKPAMLAVPAPTVAVNGVVLTAGVDYIITPDSDAIAFVNRPAQGEQVSITYKRQTFADDELDTYLTEAN